MKLYSGLFSVGLWALMFLGAQLNIAQAQDCFKINNSLSRILLEPGPAVKLPSVTDSLSIPCTKSIINFNFVIDFQLGVEPYFEDVTQLIATLTYKSTTFIFKYDKTNNTFSLPNNQTNLRDGDYKLNISAMNCAPTGVLCNNCSVDYFFSVVYNNDVTLFVDINSEPSPPVLSCFPGSSIKLSGTDLPNNGFSAQWSVLSNNQFVDIAGATSSMYTTSQPGTYRYLLAGPAGCVGSNLIAVNPPQMPEVIIQPETQVLQACEQKITGVSVKYFGTANNLEYAWTASNNGILLSGADKAEPLVGAPGIYTLVVSRKDNGCTASTSVTAVPGDIPIVNAQIKRDPDNGHLDCRLKKIILVAMANQTPSSSPFEFTWSEGSLGSELAVLEPGIYSVTATSVQSGCQGTASILISQDISVPALQIQSPRDTICDHESITLTALTQEPVTFKWSNGTSNNNNTVAPLVNGPNQYSVTITANDNGCTNSADKWIVQVDAPVVDCQQDKYTIQNGGLADLKCSTTGDEINWIANSINVRNIPSSGAGVVIGQIFQLGNALAPGIVEYAFYGKNSGCTSDRVDVDVNVVPDGEAGIFIPELVTPNGDGLNDSWDIVLPETITNPEAYQILLFNRYGAQVYEGTLANTVRVENLSDGSYYYAISKPDGGKIRGAVTVLRRQ